MGACRPRNMEVPQRPNMEDFLLLNTAGCRLPSTVGSRPRSMADCPLRNTEDCQLPSTGDCLRLNTVAFQRLREVGCPLHRLIPIRAIFHRGHTSSANWTNADTRQKLHLCVNTCRSSFGQRISFRDCGLSPKPILGEDETRLRSISLWRTDEKRSWHSGVLC